MCWNEQNNYAKARAKARMSEIESWVQMSFESGGRLRMNRRQRAPWDAQHLLPPALPPLTTRQQQLKPHFLQIFATFYIFCFGAISVSLLMILLPAALCHECLKKVGLWPYVEALFGYLVVRPICLATRIFHQTCQDSYSAAVARWKVRTIGSQDSA